MKYSFTEVSQNSGRKSTRCFFFTERKRKENLKGFPQTFENMDRLKHYRYTFCTVHLRRILLPRRIYRRLTLAHPSSCTNQTLLATNLEKITF